MTIFVAVVCTLIALFVFTCVVFGGIILFGRLWLAVRTKIAAPLLAELSEQQAEREEILRDCTAITLQALIAGQRETVAGVAREGFSAMLEVNRELLSEVRAMQAARTTPRQAILVEPTVPEAQPRLTLAAGRGHPHSPHRPIARRLLFWKP